jgi:hypothetical protein
MFLKPEDLENVRVSSLLSLLAKTGLGLAWFLNLMNGRVETIE